jgi:hypothetical protein
MGHCRNKDQLVLGQIAGKAARRSSPHARRIGPRPERSERPRESAGLEGDLTAEAGQAARIQTCSACSAAAQIRRRAGTCESSAVKKRPRPLRRGLSLSGSFRLCLSVLV